MKSMFTLRRVAVAATVAGIAALATAGCGGGSGSGSGSGQFTVLMVDAPPNLGNVTEVNVTISKVEVHPNTGGSDSSGQGADTPWKTVFQGSKSFNLLSLANVTDMTTLPHLVDGGLAAGDYDQLPLIVDSATIKGDGATD